MTMNVFIITEGGKKIGFGHITRCFSLYQAFRERNIRPHLVIDGDESLKHFWEAKKISPIVFKQDIFRSFEAEDMVIIDSYLLPKEFYQQVNSRVKVLVSIDDFNRIEYPPGVVVNGSILAEEMDYSRNNGVKYLLGTQFIPLRQAFRDVRTKPIKEEIKNILLTFGGFNHDFCQEITASLLKDISFSLTVVTGISEDKVGWENNSRLKVVRRATDAQMRDIMLESDLAIAGGGQTTYELARVGVPTIGVCFAENQLNNLQKWNKVGFLKYVGWYNRTDIFETIKYQIDSLTLEERQKMSSIGRKYVDGQGARRVVEQILSREE